MFADDPLTLNQLPKSTRRAWWRWDRGCFPITWKKSAPFNTSNRIGFLMTGYDRGKAGTRTKMNFVSETFVGYPQTLHSANIPVLYAVSSWLWRLIFHASKNPCGSLHPYSLSFNWTNSKTFSQSDCSKMFQVNLHHTLRGSFLLSTFFPSPSPSTDHIRPSRCRSTTAGRATCRLPWAWNSAMCQRASLPSVTGKFIGLFSGLHGT